MTTTKYSEYLRQAKALIDTPEKWIQGVNFDLGKRCALEAIGSVCPPYGGWGDKDHDERYYGVSAYLTWALTGKKENRDISVVGYNDRKTTTHADIMALFDKAIALAESEEEPKRLWDDLVAAEANAPREPVEAEDPKLLEAGRKD